ncbi:zinc ribbon domain-containing protein [Thermogemmatispora sp.]|uniref:zinc ribbon domain-containing protein n=1 Tax=Thermogemmatispora sp. TaxID=1968838 RepID=UPI0035E40E5B
MLRRWAEQQVHERGRPMAEADSVHTSQRCARSGRWGTGRRHAFTCSHCGAEGHADPNAIHHSRGRVPWTALRSRRRLSISPEAWADRSGCGQAPGWSQESLT